MDCFYVGYQKRAPDGLRGFLRNTSLLLLLVVVLAAVLLPLLQRPFDPGEFEYLQIREFEGLLKIDPVPTLEIQRPGIVPNTLSESSSYLLVGFGKRGLSDRVLDLGSRRVQLRGTLIHREGETMIEVVSDSVKPLQSAPVGVSSVARLGTKTVTLQGEIVGSKCYLGVMKPGRFKSHRSCATRCISGGVPPMFVVETESGDRELSLLLDADGQIPGPEILEFVAEPIRVTGRRYRVGGRWALAANPEQFERLPTDSEPR